MVRRAGSPTAPGKPPNVERYVNSRPHSPDERELDMRATVERAACYFDVNTDDKRYEVVDTHAATEGIILSLAIGILLWAIIGLGAGWL